MTKRISRMSLPERDNLNVLRNQERRQVIEELLPQAVFADYDAYAFEIEQMNRLRRRHLFGLVYFMERILYKLEKWHILK